MELIRDLGEFAFKVFLAWLLGLYLQAQTQSESLAGPFVLGLIIVFLGRELIRRKKRGR